MDWNVVITEGADTPVFRQLYDDLLKYLFEAKAINVELLLENSSAPFAKKLLAQVRAAQQSMQNGQMAEAAQGLKGIDLSQMANDPNSLAMVQQLYNSQQNVDIRQPQTQMPTQA